MNILKLLDTFNFGDNSPKLNQPASRRESLSFFGDIGAKVALAAIPLHLHLNFLKKNITQEV